MIDRKRSIIEEYYKDAPAVICTAGAYIAARNKEAEGILSDIPEGESLFSVMDPIDVLRFEAECSSREEERRLSFPVLLCEAPFFATAYFERIMSFDFVLILFSADKRERLLCEAAPTDDKNLFSFVNTILDIRERQGRIPGERRLLDLRGITRDTISELTFERNVCSCPVICTEEGVEGLFDFIPVDASLSAVVQLITLTVYLLTRPTGVDSLEVIIHKFGPLADLRMTARLVESNAEADPFEASLCESLLELCRFTAERMDCTLTSFEETDSFRSVVYSFGEREYPVSDFKTAKKPECIGDAVDFVVSQLHRITL